MFLLTSDKGSPGVTTSALAVTAAACQDRDENSRGAVLVEIDPAGGDLECLCGPHGEPGLLRAMSGSPHVSAEQLRAQLVEVTPGVRGLVAPTTGAAIGAILRTAGETLVDGIAGMDDLVVVDRGRWSCANAEPLDRLARRADVIGVVCRPTLASVEHARALLTELRDRHRVCVVVVGGTTPYGPEEISAALGVPVAGVLPWDPRGAAALVERGVSRVWSRSPVAAAASELLANLRSLTSAREEVAAHG